MNPDNLTVNFEVDVALFASLEEKVKAIEADIFAAMLIQHHKRNAEVTALSTIGGQRQIRLRD